MDMVNYCGRMVSRVGFRVFVYGPSNAKKLASNYEEYLSSLTSGWFATKQEAIDASIEPDKVPKEDIQSDYASYENLDRKTKKNTK